MGVDISEKILQVISTSSRQRERGREGGREREREPLMDKEDLDPS